jgi:hypothetical protein
MDGLDHRAGHVEERLPVDRRGGIEEHQLADPVGDPVGGTRDHHPAIAVTDQDDVAQVLEVQYRRDVLDVVAQVHLRIEQVGPLSQAGQGRRVDLVPLGAQDAGHPLIAPPAVAATVDEHVGRHVNPPLRLPEQVPAQRNTASRA